MTIECGGYRAVAGRSCSFESRTEDDIYKITLTGKEDGGLVRYSHYSIYHALPIQSFGQWLMDPNPKRVEKTTYISSQSADLKAGEEWEIYNTGLYATGS
jgi:hypothetical protein